MKISDLIPRLHGMWEESGDLEVRGYDYADITPMPIETPEVERAAGQTYVLLRP
ncbi:hypothetical protein [Streptomyces kronopolitis]|uniref:hypothetical protein n=1 Tax=Streptomyces kronopolitis TaxID=1612435 RepID=UPI00343A5DCB